MDENIDEGSERGPARKATRDSLFLLTEFTTVEGRALTKARVRNLSASGLMADCEQPPANGEAVHMNLRGIGEVTGRIVWVRGDKVGVAFDKEVDPQLARKPVAQAKGEALPDYLRALRATHLR